MLATLSPANTARFARLRSMATALARVRPGMTISGRVVEATPAAIVVRGVAAFVEVGDVVSVATAGGPARAQVARITATDVTAVPFDQERRVRLGDQAEVEGPLTIAPHASWRGRVVDAFGRPADDAGPLEQGPCAVAVDGPPPRAMSRSLIVEPFPTGVTAIDLFTPLCAGQRIGIFAGSGVGKSTSLAMLAGAPGADTVVLVLVGERGREVREFIEHTLGARRSRAITVVATSDESAMTKRLAPRTGMAVAEWLRDRGERVLLIVDSLTRLAHAERDFALASGELPVARGFPPSVFRELAALVERAGPGTARGSITAIASVLVDGDDHNDPVADAVRGLLDGHVVLDRAIAAEGRYPAIDLLASLSRLADRAAPPERNEVARQLRQLVARFEDTRDLRAINGHRPGLDPTLDRAIALVPRLYEVLRQPGLGTASRIEEAAALLAALPEAR